MPAATGAQGRFKWSSQQFAYEGYKVDLHARVDLQAGMLRQFSALISSQRPAQLQGDDRARDRVAYASAPCPASAGPFFTRASWPWPIMRGRCSSKVNRVVRPPGCRWQNSPDP
jgi:hypothetical protein